MKECYQVWVHRTSGIAYAVRLEWQPHSREYRVVASFGPLDPLAGNTEEALARYPYQRGREGAKIEEVRGEYTIHLARPARRPAR